MTLSHFAKLFSFVLFAAIFAFTDSADAFAPMTAPTVKSDSAEVCRSLDGQVMTVVGFGETAGTVVLFSPDPSRKPAEKHGFTFRKEPGGVTRKNEVTFDMFELMAEPFEPGTALRTRENWSRAYEVLFDGVVVVIDDQSKEVGRGRMSCNAAMVEYL